MKKNNYPTYLLILLCLISIELISQQNTIYLNNSNIEGIQIESLNQANTVLEDFENLNITLTGGYVIYTTDSSGEILYDEEGLPISLYIDCEGNPSGVMVEGCIGKTLEVSAENLVGDMLLNFNYEGNAINGVDYFHLQNGTTQPLPESITLSPNQPSIIYDILAQEDGTFENFELMTIKLTSIDTTVFENPITIDTIRMVENVLVFAQASVFNSGPFCPGTIVPLEAFGADTYNWFPPEFLNDPTLHNPIATITEEVTFGVALTNGPCVDTLYLEEITIFNDPPPTVIQEYVVYDNTPITLSASNASSYQWSPSTNLSCNNCPNPIYTPDGMNTTYTVEMFYTSGCYYGIDTVEITYTNPPALNLQEPIVFSYLSADSLSINYTISDSLIGATDILWDFGDGTFSEETSGMHQYEMEGTYEIKLTLNYFGLEYAFYTTIIAGSMVGINSIETNTLNIFPNPNPSRLLLNNLHDYFSYKIYDNNGKLIQEAEHRGLTNNIPLNTSEYLPGIYFLVLQSGEDTFVKKFIITTQ